MRTANKVAAVTILFWLMKIVATTLGETLGDFISMTLSLGYTKGILITLFFFILILSIQLGVKNISRLFIGWSSSEQQPLEQRFLIL